jgi:hypothetical protein
MVSWLSLVAQVVFVAVAVVTMVQSTRAPLYLFTDESIGVGCTDLEWATVLNVLGNVTKDRRRRERGLGQGHVQRQLT